MKIVLFISSSFSFSFSSILICKVDLVDRGNKDGFKFIIDVYVEDEILSESNVEHKEWKGHTWDKIKEGP